MKSRHLLLSLCLLLQAAAAQGKDTDDSHLKEQRGVISNRLAAEEAKCYEGFAVNECLIRARMQARSEQAEIQLRENATKERERRERSARHQQELLDKRDSTGVQAPGRDAQVEPRENTRTQRPSQPAPHARSAEGDKGTAERAARQREREAQAAKAHQRLLEKQRAAAERAEAQARRQARRDAKNRPPATPLPDPY